MEKIESSPEFSVGDTIRCRIDIPYQDESPWDIITDTIGLVEKINDDGSYIIAWEYGNSSTLRTHAWPHQIEKF